MAISTYAELQQAIENWLARDGDTAVSDRAAEFIALAESQFLYGQEPPFPFPNQPLRARQMLTRDAAFAVDAEYEDLPAAFIEMRRAKRLGDPDCFLGYLTPQNADEMVISTHTGAPKFFTIEGTQIRFFPAPDTAFTAELLYYAFTRLSDSATTNWLLTARPDLYLSGALMNAYWYVDQNAERATPFGAQFSGAINALNTASRRSEVAGPLIQRTLVGNP